MEDTIDVTPWNDPFIVEPAYGGIKRRVLSFTEDLMLVHYTVEEGAVFPTHTHDETHQGVFVISGEVELMGGHETTLEAGATFVVGPGVEHGIRGIAEKTQLIDAFSPPIAEYAER